MFTSIKKNRQQIFVIDGHANNVFKNSEIINKVLKCFKIKNKIKFNNKKTFILQIFKFQDVKNCKNGAGNQK